MGAVLNSAPTVTPTPDLLALAVEQSFNAVVITDAGFDNGGPHIQYANTAFCRMTGYALDELLGRSPRILQGPGTDPEVIARLRQSLSTGSPFHGNTVNYRKDGTPYHVEWTITAVRDAGGAIAHYISVQSNITERIEAETSRDLLASALHMAGAPVLITDRDGCIVFVNKAFERQTGYDADEVLGRTPQLLHSGKHDTAFYQTLWDSLQRGDTFRATFTNRRKDGSLYYAEQTLAPLHDHKGQISHFVSVSKDLTEIVQRARKLHDLAHHDALTGLLNRRGGEQALTRSLIQTGQDELPLSLVLADIDHFKAINDRHGHPAGDRILAEVAQAMQACVRSSDEVARWGGEEFLLMLPGAHAASAVQLAERIRRRLEMVRTPSGTAVTLSFGVAEAHDEESARTVLQRADQALYQAKHQGRDRVCLAG